MLSIIIPVYNAALYLRRCLESVEKQYYQDWEAVLVDDGSTDGSGDIMDEFSARDPRFRVIHVDNGGVSRARNLGIAASKGDFIAFVDADDWLDPQFYERVVPEMPDVDLIFVSDCHHFADGTIEVHRAAESHAEGHEAVEQTLLYLKQNDAGYPFFGFTWNKLFRADIIRERHIRFIEDLTLYEDEAFTDDYCRFVNSVMVFPEVFYHYRADKGGLTGRRKEEREYLMLIDHVYNMSKFYTNPKLVDYEYRRVYSLTIGCCLERNGFMQDFDKEIELLKLCRTFPNIRMAKRFRIILSFEGIERIMLKLYRLFSKSLLITMFVLFFENYE